MRKNIAYSSLLVCATYLAPLIVFPYVSRVLRPDNFGLVSFVDSIIDYFVVLSMLGISMLGIREIAAHRNNPVELSRVFSSLLTLNFITTVAACAILGAVYLFSDTLRRSPELIAAGAVKLLFNFLIIEWFYKGIEQFRYITLRSVSVKLLFVLAVFLLVRSSADVTVYYLLIVCAVVANALINFTYSRRFVRFSLRNLSLGAYTRPFVMIGCYCVLTAMYTSFNTMFLGFAADDTQVAYYVVAVKVCYIVLALFTAFTDVMVPRLAARLARGERSGFLKDISGSFSILLSFAMPAMCFILVMAPQIVAVLCGPGYESAVLPLRIALAMILVTGSEQILVYQSIIPLKKDRRLLLNSLAAACLSVVLNLSLAHRLDAVLSTVVWISCEVLVFILSQQAVWRSGIRFPLRAAVKEALLYIPLGFILWWLSSAFVSAVAGLCLAAAVTVAYIFVLHFVLKQSTLMTSLRKIPEI